MLRKPQTRRSWLVVAGSGRGAGDRGGGVRGGAVDGTGGSARGDAGRRGMSDRQCATGRLPTPEQVKSAKTLEISGTAVDSDGRPVEGAQVWIYLTDLPFFRAGHAALGRRWTFLSVSPGATGADGTFSFTQPIVSNVEAHSVTEPWEAWVFLHKDG